MRYLLHMKQKIAFLLLFFFSLQICHAQIIDRPRNEAFSFELGKAGLIFNFYFDHQFLDKHYGYRIGVGSNFGGHISATVLGAGGYYLVGKRIHHLELGVDISYLNVYESSDDQRGFEFVYPNYTIKTYHASLNIGYRIYGQRSMFRIGVSPGFMRIGYVPSGYISFGMRLRK
jgi:hypothetical protein